MFLLNFSTIKVRKTDICAQFCNPTVQEDINILQITELFTGTMNRPDEVIPWSKNYTWEQLHVLQFPSLKLQDNPFFVTGSNFSYRFGNNKNNRITHP